MACFKFVGFVLKKDILEEFLKHFPLNEKYSTNELDEWITIVTGSEMMLMDQEEMVEQVEKDKVIEQVKEMMKNVSKQEWAKFNTKITEILKPHLKHKNV